MRVTWLGQGGLLFEKNGFRIMIDPYLSDSVEKTDPNKHRRFSVPEDVFRLQPDVMIFTHDHLDHFDPETADKYLHKDSALTVLSPRSVWEKVRHYPGAHNPVLISPGTVWSEGCIRFATVKAEHSDPYAIGIILNDGEKKYYITGDTLYNEQVLSQIPTDIHAVFLPVNGVGNNMNMTDAATFAAKVDAKFTVPIHYGLFDDLQIDTFAAKNKLTLKLFEETEF